MVAILNLPMVSSLATLRLIQSKQVASSSQSMGQEAGLNRQLVGSGFAMAKDLPFKIL